MRECSPPQTCHMSCVTCHVSRVTCQNFFLHFLYVKENGLSGGASRWRVCYQRGLPRLVYIVSSLSDHLDQASNLKFVKLVPPFSCVVLLKLCPKPYKICFTAYLTTQMEQKRSTKKTYGAHRRGAVQGRYLHAHGFNVFFPPSLRLCFVRQEEKKYKYWS